MKFSELHPGRVIRCGPVVMTENSILDFARAHDPQWFHTDLARAEASVWKGLIASGWHTCCVAMRLAVDNILAGSESFGSPGLAYVEWKAPVRPGDALSLTVEVLEHRRSGKNPDLGIVRWRWQLANQRDEPVLALEATSLFDLAPQSAGLSASARA
jgi:acyl dehydratase